MRGLWGSLRTHVLPASSCSLGWGGYQAAATCVFLRRRPRGVGEGCLIRNAAAAAGVGPATAGGAWGVGAEAAPLRRRRRLLLLLLGHVEAAAAASSARGVVGWPGPTVGVAVGVTALLRLLLRLLRHARGRRGPPGHDGGVVVAPPHPHPRG